MPSPLPAADADLPPLAHRFCRYVQVDTTSDPDSETVPSTARQLDLTRLLADELRTMGAREVTLTEYGVLTATVPGSAPEAPVLGLVAHVDTSPDAPGGNVTPLIHPAYDGSVIRLPGDPSVTLDPDERPALRDHRGHDLITSDGTTLLGSDDKAGVAVMMQLAEDLLASASPDDETPLRPTVRLLFTPDEEVGRGTDHVDLEALGADVAYTLDGSGRDRLNVETFNAAEALLTVRGVGVHPGYATGRLVSALKIAATAALALPADEAPETTAGRDGYFHPHTLTGDVERAELRVLLRDFGAEGLVRRKRLVREIARRLAEDHPQAEVKLAITDSYRNMLEHIRRTDPRVIEVAQEAAEMIGVSLLMEPVRGGTDGARLSERGLPTPNLFTGGHDFHSRREWNSVQNLEHTLAFTHALVTAWGRRPHLTKTARGTPPTSR